MPARTLSSDSMTLNSMTQYDQIDSEVRLQIQSNIHVLYDPSTAPSMHIATCRGHDGLYLAFLVKQDHLAKALTSPQPLSSEPKSARSAAMLSLLEATEQRIAEQLIKTNNSSSSARSSSKTAGAADPRIIRMPTGDKADDASTSSAEKARDKRFKTLWKKHTQVELPAVRNVVD